jgi:hypothetical protein
MALLLTALGVAFAAYLLQYLIPHFFCVLFCRDQDLVKRYPGAKWGLVTGASSGEREGRARGNGSLGARDRSTAPDWIAREKI